MGVELFLKRADPYSVRLRELLRRKGVAFAERYVTDEEVEFPLPQLVVDDEPLGTYEDVGSMDLRGELDRRLP